MNKKTVQKDDFGEIQFNEDAPEGFQYRVWVPEFAGSNTLKKKVQILLWLRGDYETLSDAQAVLLDSYGIWSKW